MEQGNGFIIKFLAFISQTSNNLLSLFAIVAGMLLFTSVDSTETTLSGQHLKYVIFHVSSLNTKPHKFMLLIV